MKKQRGVIPCKHIKGISLCRNDQDCTTCSSSEAMNIRLEESKAREGEYLTVLRRAVPIVEAHNARQRGSRKSRTHQHLDFLREFIEIESPRSLRELVLALRDLAVMQSEHPVIYQVEFDGGDPHKAIIRWRNMKRTTRGKRLEEILKEVTESPEIGN